MDNNRRWVLFVSLAIAVGVGGPTSAAINPEDFESYEPNTVGDWTGTAEWNSTDGWIIGYNSHGWAANGTGYLWADGGYSSPQVLRRNDTTEDSVAFFWNQSADITLFPAQTLALQHRGLVQNTTGYGRVIVGIGENRVEYDNYTGGTGLLGTTPLPTNNVSWTFGTGYSYDWFETQIECDYANGLVRARFGQVQGSVWNDWTDWQPLSDTAQPEWCKFTIDGKTEIDEAAFTATPAEDWIVITDDFESYTPDTVSNWTGSAAWSGDWVLASNPDGWAASGSGYLWPDGGYYSPQVLRRNDAEETGNVFFWEQSADIAAYPTQTLALKHRGLQFNTAGYGRVSVGIGNNRVEYDNYTGGTGYLGATPLPQNNVSWTFGTGYSYDWFETQVECDFVNGLVRGRFGQVQGGVWNDWTDWQPLSETTQPAWCQFIIDGRVEIDEAVFTGAPASDGSGSWNVDASGSWHDKANWTARPADNTHTATFGAVITGDSVVYLEADVTAKAIVFDNANEYVIAGSGSINLEADSGNAGIDVQAGSHQLQAKVVLGSDTDVDVPAGSSLTFNNMLDLNGYHLNFTGSGTLAISGLLSGGGVSNVGGGTLIVADKNGDGIADLEELALLANNWLE